MIEWLKHNAALCAFVALGLGGAWTLDRSQHNTAQQIVETQRLSCNYANETTRANQRYILKSLKARSKTVVHSDPSPELRRAFKSEIARLDARIAETGPVDCEERYPDP